jgi:hypothetical protein
VPKILGTRYNEQDMSHELLVVYCGFAIGEATCEFYSDMAVDVSEIVAKFRESHNDPDMVSEM